jgi:cytoskeletal protein RodZ
MAGSAGKTRLNSYQFAVAQSIASNYTSTAMDIRNLDNLAFFLVWTGTPTGTFAVQVSEDYTQSSTGTVINAGTWVATTASSGTAVPSGSASAGQLVFTSNANSWVRIVYTASSGTGTLNGYLSGKSIS